MLGESMTIIVNDLSSSVFSAGRHWFLTTKCLTKTYG